MEPTESASAIPELFYDLLSILMPGLYLLIAIYFAKKEIVESLTNAGIIHPTLTVIVVAYLLGFLLYSVSSFFVAKRFTTLLGNPSQLLLLGDPSEKYYKRNQQYFMGVPATSKHLREGVEDGVRQLRGQSFRITEENINEVFEYCRNYVMERSARRAISIRKEQAYGEMCRSMVVISFTLLLLLPIFKWWIGVPEKWFWWQLGVHAIFLVSFTYRYGQARLIAPYLIYATFTVMMGPSSGSELTLQD